MLISSRCSPRYLRACCRDFTRRGCRRCRRSSGIVYVTWWILEIESSRFILLVLPCLIIFPCTFIHRMFITIRSSIIHKKIRRDVRFLCAMLRYIYALPHPLNLSSYMRCKISRPFPHYHTTSSSFACAIIVSLYPATCFTKSSLSFYIIIPFSRSLVLCHPYVLITQILDVK